MCALKLAHSKCTKLCKNIYPHRLDAYATPAHSESGTPTTSRVSASSRKNATIPLQSTDKEKNREGSTLTAVECTVRTSVYTSNLSTTS